MASDRCELRGHKIVGYRIFSRFCYLSPGWLCTRGQVFENGLGYLAGPSRKFTHNLSCGLCVAAMMIVFAGQQCLR